MAHRFGRLWGVRIEARVKGASERARWPPRGCCLAGVDGRGRRDRKTGRAGVVIYSSAPRASIVGPGSPDSGTVHSPRLVPLSEPRYARERRWYFRYARTSPLGSCINREGQRVKSRGGRGVRSCRERRRSHFSSFAKLNRAIK